MNKNVVFSHQTDEWTTPKPLYDLFMSYGFGDPCPLGGKMAINERWNKPMFVNPPYSNIEAFADWFIAQWRMGSTGRSAWFLVPARTDTKWFEKLFGYCHTLVFIKGRLSFGDGKGRAPFPSVLMYCNYSDDRQHVHIVDRDHLIGWLKYAFEVLGLR